MVNTSFILTFAIGTAVYGKLSDVYGVKKLLLIGLLLYGAGSAAGALLHFWYPAVIIARLIQGAGIAAVPALIMVIIAKSIEPEHQGKAFGILGSMIAFGEGIGPVIGGIVTGYLHWFYLFLLPMVTLLTIPFVIRVLPDEQVKKGKMDTAGALWLTLGVAAFTMFTTTHQWALLVASILLLAVFMVHIRRVEQPFIDPGLFRRIPFMANLLSASLLLGTTAGYISMVPYMMRDVYDMDAGMIGLGILFPGTASVILFGMAGGVLTDKRGTVFTMLAGLGMLGAGFVIAALFADRHPWLISVATVLIFGGLSFVKTVISASAAASLGEEEAGEGMGMLGFTCFLAEGIGVAVVGGLLVQPWLRAQLIPVLTQTSAFLYSNLLLILLAAVAMGGLVYLMAFRWKVAAKAE